MLKGDIYKNPLPNILGRRKKVLIYDENNNFRAIYQKKGKEFEGIQNVFKNILMLKNIPMF